MKKFFERETVWLGASARMNEAFKGANMRAKPPKSLEAFLSTAEWKGSTVVYTQPGIAEVTHPSGAIARLHFPWRLSKCN